MAKGEGKMKKLKKLRWLVCGCFCILNFVFCISTPAFEGRIHAVMTRGSQTDALLYTVGTNFLRVEMTATNWPNPVDILNRNSGELTMLFPNNRSFVRLKPPWRIHPRCPRDFRKCPLDFRLVLARSRHRPVCPRCRICPRHKASPPRTFPECPRRRQCQPCRICRRERNRNPRPVVRPCPTCLPGW